MSMATQQSIILAAVLPVICLLKYLTFIYAKRDTFLYRMLVGTGEIICLMALNIGFIYYVPIFADNASGSVVGIAASVFTGLIAILIHSQNLMGERKRPLTDLQKAELMDM